MPDQVKRYADQYGPYAFGVLSLLILWYAIFRPMQEQQAVQQLRATEMQLEAARTVSDAVSELTHHSDAMRRMVDDLAHEVEILKGQ